MKPGINFWTKDTGNSLSHSKGLTQEQVNALQQLKVGDRLILWKNDVKEEHDSNLTLKLFLPKVVKKEE